MLSRKTALERRKNHTWQCMACQQIDGDGDIEPEDHSCTLEKLHYGAHLCWCGWRFSEFEVLRTQLRLPLEDQERAT